MGKEDGDLVRFFWFWFSVSLGCPKFERTHGWWNAGYGIPYVTFTLCNVGSWKVGGWKVGIGMVVIVLVTFALIKIMHMCSMERRTDIA